MSGPMSDERALELFAAFRRNLHTPLLTEIVQAPSLSGGAPMPGALMPFYETAADTLREISNTINEFQRWTNTLFAWQPIYASCNESEQLSLLLQHIRPYSILALGAPQSLRGRMIFAAVACGGHANHSVHAADSRLQWSGGHTSMGSASRVGRPWSCWPILAAALNEIGLIADDTGDFRNQREHGHPRNIAMGLTSMVNVNVEDGERTFGFGTRSAIPLDEVIRLATEEHHRVTSAYTALCNLLAEQFAALMTHHPLPTMTPSGRR